MSGSFLVFALQVLLGILTHLGAEFADLKCAVPVTGKILVNFKIIVFTTF